jgi:hypothetical protein
MPHIPGTYRAPLLVFVALLLLCAGAVSAQRGRSIVQRVHFPPGRTTAVLRGTVRRGLSHDYLLGARSGQTMSVHLVSGGNLTFTILNPDRDAVVDNAKDWSGELPLSGDYRINVLPDTATSAPGSFTLEVTIR